MGEEYRAGTDPGNAASFPDGTPATPRNLDIVVDPDGTVTLTWLGSSRAVYTVQSSPTAESWTSYPIIPVEVAPGRFEWTLPSSDPNPAASFFQVAFGLE